jgi:catechol 2,3-dioxygenase-like lactoylglutathione lyase family enzyme
VTDLNAAVEWYTTVLGFEPGAYWSPDAPNYAHALRNAEVHDRGPDGNELGFVRNG